MTLPLTEVDKIRKIRALRFSETIPEIFRPLFQRVIMGKAPPRQVIKSHCQQCVGFEEVFDRVRNCSAYSCALWSARPYQHKRIRCRLDAQEGTPKVAQRQNGSETGGADAKPEK